MSKELKNITDAVMNKIQKGDVKMRPRAYFIIGAILTFAGLVSSIVVAAFSVGLMRFSLRAHGPKGAYRLDQLIESFPWWAVILAIVGLGVGIWLIRRYDFSYKIDFKVIIAGFILAVMVGGLIIDMIGVNDALIRKGPLQRMMRHYSQENEIRR